MNSLKSELLRLYLPLSPLPDEGANDQSSPLIDSSDKVRSMVIELTRPADWKLLSRVWYGVQSELALPAPAIAVSGIDGLQLWFSLADPVSTGQAHAFVDGLRFRFLPEVEPGRVRLMPAADATAMRPDRHAQLIPAHYAGNWSAFVAPDLAPIFAEEPWLDMPPNEEGQATLLRGLQTMDRADFEATLKKLDAAAQPRPYAALTTSAVGSDASPVPSRSSTRFADDEPRQFLLRVMNDETVELSLRIEAAKALL
ncbi:hypothetical protein BH09PSE5_BH09PSE5_00570 [soil metagenome]